MQMPHHALGKASCPAQDAVGRGCLWVGGEGRFVMGLSREEEQPPHQAERPRITPPWPPTQAGSAGDGRPLEAA